MAIEIIPIPTEIVEKVRNEQKNNVIGRRIAVLREMDEVIRYMNDEEAMEPWLMCGVPDEASVEDYEFIAENHEEFIDVVKLFARLVSRYAEEDF
jgi:hypothetical protein